MARVQAVAAHDAHMFSKPLREEIVLLAGLGVEGDAHCGETVKHRSRVARDPTQPNLRQVHLIQSELFSELEGGGFVVRPGDLGENVTTQGIDLLSLSQGTLLQLGTQAQVEVTGLRNPCIQIDQFAKGLMQAVFDRAADGSLIRKAGVMAIVRQGGVIRPGDRIQVVMQPEVFRPLAVV